MSGTIEDFVKTLKEGSEPWLLLFDIDGTLVDIGGKGMAALRKTAVEVFGGDGHRVAVSVDHVFGIDHHGDMALPEKQVTALVFT